MAYLKIEEYKGFTIKVDNYLKILNYPEIDFEKSTNNFYEIYENGKELCSTLNNDDKMWSIDSAIESAKRDIDEYLQRGRTRGVCAGYL